MGLAGPDTQYQSLRGEQDFNLTTRLKQTIS